MIAEKMAMTIRETSHSAMVFTPADRLQRRHDYMEKARACRAIIKKLCPQPSGNDVGSFSSRWIARTLRRSFSGVAHVRFRHGWSGNAWARDSVKVTVQLPRKVYETPLDAVPVRGMKCGVFLSCAAERPVSPSRGLHPGVAAPLLPPCVTPMRHGGGSGSVISPACR